MKIAIVNTHDLEGGAARAAFRLHEALLLVGHDVRMFVARKSTDHQTVIGPSRLTSKLAGRLYGGIDSIPKQLYRNRSVTPFSVAWIGFREWIDEVNAFDPDIVHLHWINHGFVTPGQLARINAPIVWSLHDMWAFTGGCHYTDDGCTRYAAACGACPVLASSRERDLSRRVWNRKRQKYSKIKNLTIIGVSQWLSEEARRSALFHDRHIVNLPNPIDTSIFRPVDRSFARQVWNLPPHAPIVLFGAMSSTSDPRKGYDLLIAALESTGRSDAHLCVFGASSRSSDRLAGLPVRFVGRLHDDVSLLTLYSSADVMVVPSRSEAFGQTATEAMACGTPVVAFAATGLTDIVDSKINGYLAKPYDPEDLANGIRWVLEDDSRREALGRAAREKVLRELDYRVVAPRYVELYRSVLEKNTKEQD